MPVRSPKVAVLLAAYNGMQWIEEQLDSLIKQSGVDVAVYISVDRSTDGTQAWCAAYAVDHPCVTLLPDAGTFGGASRNFFRLIRDVDFEPYDFVAFADQDDVWHVEKLHRAITAIQDRQVEAYSSNVTAFWPNGKTSLLDKAQSQVSWDFLFEAAGPGCTYVFNKQFSQALKTSMADHWLELQKVTLHDWYFYAYARSHGYRWYIDPLPTMEYRQHESNQVGANTGLSSLVSRYKTIHDGWWFAQVRMITLLVGLGDDPFVKSWLQLRRRQLMKLSFSAWKCRRRVRDKIFFFCICWAAALLGNKHS
ncbi:glycosyl transferase [Pseudomonas sp. DTU12.3]|uniref:glycosyltransferase n=1 Tax=Pseudomonas sp. DTU12.3 TaxID=2073078 RepID=UPI001010CA42|nr:glycosyltransferase [Pseudomonas sp. DTU12.3]QAX86222.1 glycosyl transferase [Pseudomonas sp. DTU12.3]